MEPDARSAHRSSAGRDRRATDQALGALADLRYALLLGFIEHHLLTSDADDRANLASWAITEMFMLGNLAEKLAPLPQGSGVAALPFTLPASVHLPATEPERWQLQRERTTAAIEHVRQMQAAEPADADDRILSSILQSDTASLALMHEGPPPAPRRASPGTCCRSFGQSTSST